MQFSVGLGACSGTQSYSGEEAAAAETCGCPHSVHTQAQRQQQENRQWVWSEPGECRAKWPEQLLQPICSSVSFPAAFLISEACHHLNLLPPALVWGHLCGRVPEGPTHGLSSEEPQCQCMAESLLLFRNSFTLIQKHHWILLAAKS
ncbi:uncharacterized protein LOC128931720 isoform X2 [Callithrix jacchus]